MPSSFRRLSAFSVASRRRMRRAGLASAAVTLCQPYSTTSVCRSRGAPCREPPAPREPGFVRQSRSRMALLCHARAIKAIRQPGRSLKWPAWPNKKPPELALAEEHNACQREHRKPGDNECPDQQGTPIEPVVEQPLCLVILHMRLLPLRRFETKRNDGRLVPGFMRFFPLALGFERSRARGSLSGRSMVGEVGLEP